MHAYTNQKYFDANKTRRGMISIVYEYLTYVKMVLNMLNSLLFPHIRFSRSLTTAVRKLLSEKREYFEASCLYICNICALAYIRFKYNSTCLPRESGVMKLPSGSNNCAVTNSLS